MKYIHIVSVGSSIISNYRNSVDNSLPGPQDDEAYKKVLTDRKIKKNIYDFVCSSPYKSSAELNSIQQYLKKNEVNEIHFVYTKTYMCQIAMKILKKYLNEKYSVKVSGSQGISGYYREYRLNPETASNYFEEDIKKLLDKLVKFIERKKNKDTKILINATGGFKAETAILVMAGSLTKTPVYYRHEFFGSNITFPELL